MTVSTLTVVPEATASGTAPCAEPTPHRPASRLLDDPIVQALRRAARSDYPAWRAHVEPAAGCTRPIRLHGTMWTVDLTTHTAGRWTYGLRSGRSTEDMPDGVIYKPCGNRRAAVCPSCSKRYQRDAYQLIRAGLAGGKGVTETVAQHPAVFPTLTAPSFGKVHTHYVARHTCKDRRACDCRPAPCHADRERPTCVHGRPAYCFARHAETDRVLGSPLCVDCYDYDAHVVWQIHTGELWRRTRIGMERALRRLAATRGVDPNTVRLAYGKAGEMQRRAAMHFHVIVRLDGTDPDDRSVIVPPPAAISAEDLVQVVEATARQTSFTTNPHPVRPTGWEIAWGEQLRTKVIIVGGDGEITDTKVAGYLAKYATKATEITGHTAGRLTPDTIDAYADPEGDHTQRLVDACWRLGTPAPNPQPLPTRERRQPSSRARQPWTCPDCGNRTRLTICRPCAPTLEADRSESAPAGRRGAYARLRRWAHMLGYGGHFLTKSRTYSVTFAFLRDQRIAFHRTPTTGPEPDGTSRGKIQETTLAVNFLQYVGAGWHTTGDALLANTSAALAREQHEIALAELAALTA